MTAPPLPLDDAVLRLKAEIIAQDWRLSPKRAARLDEAFVSLKGHFRERRAIHAMLVMAANVLDYIKGHGVNPPDTIDFLKEAMAHVVSLHEELGVDLNREQEVLRNLLVRFNRLKDKIRRQTARQEDRPGAEPSPARSGAESPPAAPLPEPGAMALELLAEFRAALSQTPAPGPELARLLGHWLASPEVAGLLDVGLPSQGSVRERPTPEAETVEPPVLVKILTINSLTLALPCRMIAMSQAISPAQAAKYTQNAAVPLADFARLLRRLSSLLAGNLAKVKERALRQLILPLLIPRGSDLPETPNGDSRALVVLSHGNWHGALVCDTIEDTEPMMVGYTKQQDGDLSGLAKLDNGSLVPLLDAQSMLQREGILLLL